MVGKACQENRENSPGSAGRGDSRSCAQGRRRDDSRRAAKKQTSCASFGTSFPSLCLPSSPTMVTLQLLVTPRLNPAPLGLLKIYGSKKPPKHRHPAQPSSCCPTAGLSQRAAQNTLQQKCHGTGRVCFATLPLLPLAQDGGF